MTTQLVRIPNKVIYYKNGKLDIKRTVSRELKREVAKLLNKWQAYTER